LSFDASNSFLAGGNGTAASTSPLSTDIRRTTTAAELHHAGLPDV
jgi:hypothetical protein